MPTIAAARAAFATTAKATATPQALLVMLYDRLVLDLQRAEAAHEADDLAGVNRHLNHAQDIVTELAGALDASAWDGGPALASLYAYLLTELVGANVAKDVERIAGARAVVEPLRDAWRTASGGAATAPGGGALSGAPATPAPTVPERRLVAALGGTA